MNFWHRRKIFTRTVAVLLVFALYLGACDGLIRSLQQEMGGAELAAKARAECAACRYSLTVTARCLWTSLQDRLAAAGAESVTAALRGAFADAGHLTGRLKYWGATLTGYLNPPPAARGRRSRRAHQHPARPLFRTGRPHHHHLAV
ncbi:hypothetical protein [Thermodesulfitimonas sp.]